MTKDILTVTEAARHLDVSVKHVRELVRAEKLDCIWRNGDRRFLLSALDEYRDRSKSDRPTSVPKSARKERRYLVAVSAGDCEWCSAPIDVGQDIAILTDGETYVHDFHLIEGEP